MARISFAVPTVADAGDDSELLTTRNRNAIAAIAKTGLPVSNEIAKDRHALVLFTTGAAYTDVVAIAKPTESGREVADALAGGLRGTDLDAADLRYSKDEDLAVVVGNASHGHFGAASADTTLPIRQVGNAFRLRGWDVTIVIRAGKYGERTAVGLAEDEGPNWMWYSARDFEADSSLKFHADLSGGMRAAFYFFLLGPWLLCGLGVASAMIVGKRESIPVARRRALYPRLAIWPTFGSIAVHAPIAFWFLIGRGYKPFADLWFGTYSASALMPFILVPLPMLFILIPLSARIERKLFGPDPKTPPPVLPQLSVEEKAVTKRSRSLGLFIASVGLGLYFLTSLIPSKSALVEVARFGALALSFFGSAIAAFLYRNQLKAFDVAVEDPQLEMKVHAMAGRMGLTLKKFKIDGSAMGRTQPNASASASLVVTISARLRDILAPDELESVIAHELAHLKLRHPQRRRTTQIAMFSVIFFPAAGSFIAMMSVQSSSLRFVVLGVPLLVIPVVLLFSAPAFRRQEYAADRLMLETTRNLDAAISAFGKMVANSPSPYVHEVEVGTSHPAMSKRIERLREIAAELGLSSHKTA